MNQRYSDLHWENAIVVGVFTVEPTWKKGHITSIFVVAVGGNAFTGATAARGTTSDPTVSRKPTLKGNVRTIR